MKNIVKIIFKTFLVALIAIGGTTSCSEDTLEEKAYSFIAKENFYKTAKDAESAVMATYGSLQSNKSGQVFYGQAYMNVVLMSDDQVTINRNATFFQMDDFNYSPDNSLLTRFWNLAYQAINISNVAIHRIPPIDMDEDLKNSYIAEARCIRAHVYFILVRMWGAIPFTTDEIIDEESANVSKGTVDEIYTSIIEDLKFAENNLPSIRPASEFGRLTSWAAKAMLADVYLTREVWSEAASKANEVIASGQYALLGEFENIHREQYEQSEEIIWSIVYDGFITPNSIASFSHDGGGGNAACMNGVKVWSVDIASDMWLNWSDSDPRKSKSVGDTYLHTNGTIRPTTAGYPEFKKYYAPNETGVHTCPLNKIIYRYADVLLMYAEASSQASGGPTSASYDAINRVRRRGYEQPVDQISAYDLTPGLSAGDFRDSVLLECSYEFVVESNRLFDLMRSGQYPQILVDMGKNVRPGATLFPIPTAEINANSSLTSDDQNEGY